MTSYRKNVLHDALLMLFNPIIRITHSGIGTQTQLPNLEDYINGTIKVSKDGVSLAHAFWDSLEALTFPDGSKWDDYTPGGIPENNWDEWADAAERFDADPDAYIADFPSTGGKDVDWKNYFSDRLSTTIVDLHHAWTRSNNWCDIADAEYKLMATKFRATPSVSFD